MFQQDPLVNLPAAGAEEHYLPVVYLLAQLRQVRLHLHLRRDLAQYLYIGNQILAVFLHVCYPGGHHARVGVTGIAGEEVLEGGYNKVGAVGWSARAGSGYFSGGTKVS